MTEQLMALRKRILAPFQAQRGANVWAPWGKSGWSAVVIMKAQRKWAKGIRVKPHNGEETAKGRVPMSQLISRDPKLKGKDRPSLTPAEIFAEPEKEPEPVEEIPVVPTPPRKTDSRDFGTFRESSEQREARLNPPGHKPRSEMTKTEQKRHDKRMKQIFNLLEDDSNDADW